jgi:hypothetical protein
MTCQATVVNHAHFSLLESIFTHPPQHPSLDYHPPPFSPSIGKPAQTLDCVPSPWWLPNKTINLESSSPRRLKRQPRNGHCARAWIGSRQQPWSRPLMKTDWRASRDTVAGRLSWRAQCSIAASQRLHPCSLHCTSPGGRPSSKDRPLGRLITEPLRRNHW